MLHSAERYVEHSSTLTAGMFHVLHNHEEIMTMDEILFVSISIYLLILVEFN